MKRINYLILAFLMMTITSCNFADIANNNPIEESETKFEIDVQDDLYEIFVKQYKSKDIEINYPQLERLENKEIQSRINQLLKDQALNILSENIETDNYSINIEFEIPWSGSEIFSVQYFGIANDRNAAYLTNLFYTTNISIRTGELLRLNDLVSIDEYFVSLFKSGTIEMPGIQDNSELKTVVKEKLDSLHTEDIIKRFEEADPIKVEDRINKNLSYSYYTKNSIGISFNVPHALGDYVKIEIPFDQLIRNMNNEASDYWQDFFVAKEFDFTDYNDEFDKNMLQPDKIIRIKDQEHAWELLSNKLNLNDQDFEYVGTNEWGGYMFYYIPKPDDLGESPTYVVNPMNGNVYWSFNGQTLNNVFFENDEQIIPLEEVPLLLEKELSRMGHSPIFWGASHGFLHYEIKNEQGLIIQTISVDVASGDVTDKQSQELLFNLKAK